MPSVWIPRTLLLALVASGCAHRVTVLSTPAGAVVRRVGDDLPLGKTPLELEEPWRPGRPMELRVSSAGYRTVDVKVRRRLLRNDRDFEVVMVRRHPEAGEWQPSEATP